MYGFGKVTVEYCTFRHVRFALYLKRNSSTETLRNNFFSSFATSSLPTLIEAYENKHYDFGPGDPVEAIKFRME